MKFATTAALLATGAAASSSSSEQHSAVAANPIRKVVTMMQKMAKKLEAEAEAEAELYEKFECYCKKTTEELQAAIDKAGSVGPISPDDIEAKKNEVLAIEDEVKALKGEKVEDESSLKAARANRKKEHDVYEKVVTEDKETEESAESALKALGVSTTEAPSFLQEGSENGFGAGVSARWLKPLMKAFGRSKVVAPDQREKVTAFLQGRGDAQPGDSADVKIYIEDVEHEAEDHIVKEDQEENEETVDYGHVKTSKKSEIALLLDQMERKMKAIGDLKVEVVNMEHDMAGDADTLEENKKMLAEVSKSCSDKAAAWEERKQYRADEQLALADAIKMLNSDDALELFKKTIKPTSLLQLPSNDGRKRAQAIVDSLRAKRTHHRPALNFISLALQGKKVNFDAIFKKIDEMVDLMKKEQADDDSKKDYCEKEFSTAEKNVNEIGKKIKQLGNDVEQGKTGISKIDEEVATLRAGIKELDASVAEASENRKDEHTEYEELIASNSAAVKLIGMAKNRLNEFYNPALAPDTATTTANPYAFVQVAEDSSEEGPVEVNTPPPTFEGGYNSKGQESNGVMKMMDTLINDLEKEMTVAKVEEKNAQKDYEETVADAKQKRKADTKTVEQRAQARSDLEADLALDKESRKTEKQNLMAARKYVSNLHGECDWLVQNFDLRKQARTEETESMKNAKAVLAGADFGF
eukprot:TRINITY_DN899_c0_g1_i5.p1 TRINITY_DN899_c0_g1~~TRINITY_DN899_c0_g1_i5.p1  ORF type:complete len:697 (-),score=247.18 TRINITY_DN899_c0_g1_i5:89-2179(-)